MSSRIFFLFVFPILLLPGFSFLCLCRVFLLFFFPSLMPHFSSLCFSPFFMPHVSSQWFVSIVFFPMFLTYCQFLWFCMVLSTMPWGPWPESKGNKLEQVVMIFYVLLKHIWNCTELQSAPPLARNWPPKPLSNSERTAVDGRKSHGTDVVCGTIPMSKKSMLFCFNICGSVHKISETTVALTSGYVLHKYT